MSADRYLQMCKAMGDEPDMNKMPPDYGDFPSYVHTAMEIFNSLPDTYSGGMSSVYAGKNISALPVLFEIFEVSNHNKMKIFEVVSFLDNRARKQAIKAAERAAKKAK